MLAHMPGIVYGLKLLNIVRKLVCKVLPVLITKLYRYPSAAVQGEYLRAGSRDA